MSYHKRDRKLILKSLKSYRVKPEVTSRAIEDYFTTLDCPRSLACWILFREGEHSQLASLEFNPLHYENIAALRDAYAATKFLSKYKKLASDIDLDEVAYKKFSSSEETCKQVNKRFRAYGSQELIPPAFAPIHNALVCKIHKILGRFRPEEFFFGADWGPGATTRIKRRDASSPNKFQSETGITRDLYDLLWPNNDIALSPFRAAYPKWSMHLEKLGFDFDVGNKVVTVPKDSTQNRVIAIEPGINLWFQKAIGSALETRLRKCGVSLREQSINQSFALEGSKSSRVATVDFSSASDTISRSVVRELFSLGDAKLWYDLMDYTRSHFGLVLGEQIQWEKFSSMGNGFTFQLESLIFYAIALTCTERLGLSSADVSVYGDDVIIPTDAFELYQQVCEFYGFTVNRKKSHFSSGFRESCGAHYYLGSDVKPIYLKDRMSTVLDVFKLANAIRRLAHRRNNCSGCDRSFEGLFASLVKSVPKVCKLFGPEGYGDGFFIGNFDEATPNRARGGVEGHLIRLAQEASITSFVDYDGLLFSRLWAASPIKLSFKPNRVEPPDRMLRNSVASGGRTRLALVERVLVPRWYDLGQWY